jgi:hypothetical protein
LARPVGAPSTAHARPRTFLRVRSAGRTGRQPRCRRYTWPLFRGGDHGAGDHTGGRTPARSVPRRVQAPDGRGILVAEGPTTARARGGRPLRHQCTLGRAPPKESRARWPLPSLTTAPTSTSRLSSARRSRPPVPRRDSLRRCPRLSRTTPSAGRRRRSASERTRSSAPTPPTWSRRAPAAQPRPSTGWCSPRRALRRLPATCWPLPHCPTQSARSSRCAPSPAGCRSAVCASRWGSSA